MSSTLAVKRPNDTMPIRGLIPKRTPAARGEGDQCAQGERRQVFFLRGHPRSGTNWAGNLLNLHPKILVLGEFHLEAVSKGIERCVSEPWHVTHDPAVKALIEQRFGEMVEEVILTQAAHKPGATWIGDRTPREIRFMAPGAPHILMMRDPRDVLVSYTFHQMTVLADEIRRPAFWEHMRADAEAHRDDPEHFLKHPQRLLRHGPWVRFVMRCWGMRLDEDREAMQKAEADPSVGSVLLVRYEDLHADTDRTRAEMYRFLGLDPSEGEPLSPETATTPGFAREDPTSQQRKGMVGDWRTYANDNTVRIIKEELGDALIELGYEKDTNW